MSKMFGNLKTADDVVDSEDNLGGGGFAAVPSGVYPATIKVAYARQSQGGAQSITVIADLDMGDGKTQEIRDTHWVTNRNGETFYVDKNDGKTKRPLPGFTTIEDLCLFTTGEGLLDQDFEEKTLKLYNPDSKKEEPTPVPTIAGLTGQPALLGVLRVIEDKTKKDNGGNYIPTGETRTINTIDKVFHPETRHTVPEVRNEVDEPEFHDAWLEKNRDKDRNKATGAAAGAGNGGASGSGRPGGTTASGAAKSGNSLFKKKA